MSFGIVGRKLGMTRVFAEDGRSIPVSVIQVEKNVITQIKTPENDGYYSLQLTTGTKKRSRVSKPSAGKYAKAGVEAGRGLWEFRTTEDIAGQTNVGDTLTIDLFKVGQKVDLTGTSKGKGFAGGIKRHNFAGQDNSHGNSVSHRAPGSIGQCQTPGRVFKGKKMAGHLGDVRCTIQNAEVIQIDNERNLLLVKGAAPGAKQSDVIVRPASKYPLPEFTMASSTEAEQEAAPSEAQAPVDATAAPAEEAKQSAPEAEAVKKAQEAKENKDDAA